MKLMYREIVGMATTLPVPVKKYSSPEILNSFVLEKEKMEQVRIDPLKEQEIRMRNVELERAFESMMQIVGLLRSIEKLVVEQGSLVDRIDVNLEHSRQHVQRANTRLANVRIHESNQARKLFLLFLLLLVFVLFIAVASGKDSHQ